MRIILLLLPVMLASADENLIMDLITFPIEMNLNAILKDMRSQCGRDIERVLEAAKNQEIWGMKFMDSLPKFPYGVLGGTVMNYGNYDECLEVEAPHFKPQYCLALIRLTKRGQNLSKHYMPHMVDGNFSLTPSHHDVFSERIMNFLTFGFCAPRSCNHTQLQYFSNRLVHDYKMVAWFKFLDSYCTTGDILWHGSTIFAISFFAIIILILIISSLYDVLVYRKPESYVRRLFKPVCEKYDGVIIAFSIYTNGLKLFSTKSPAKQNITSMYGLRSISLAWIMLGHCYLYNGVGPVSNLYDMLKWSKSYDSILLTLAPLNVETFFVLSGFLLFKIHITVTKTTKIPLGVYYFHRILRLLPALAAIVIAYCGMFSLIATGPYYPSSKFMYQLNCWHTWWKTMLFINNYENTEQMCIGETWYISVDTQLYFIAPLFLYIIYRNTKTGICVLISLITCSVIYTLLICYYNEYPVPMQQFPRAYIDQVYINTWARSPSWLIGALLGYYFTTKHYENYFSTKVYYIGWTITVMTFSIIMYYMIFFNHENISEPIYTSTFTAFHRPLFTAGLCWMLYACTKCPDSYVNRFLSAKVFMVFSRLNYSMYLIHTFFIITWTAHRRPFFHYANVNVMFEYGAQFLIITTMSIFWVLAFESPIYILERHLLSKHASRKQANSNVAHNNHA